MISLCMIVGNVEDLIERCLESFAPIAGEICVVQAIGAQREDRTMDIAQKFGARLGCYLNKPEHADWPHIDDFAAARQVSFDMAKGDYCMWADSDDVFEGDPQLVRDFAARGNYPALIVPYKIFAKGLVVNRVRVMARDSGRWKHAVHEDYKFHVEPVNAIQDDRCAVVHLPRMDGSKNSTPRNLRILESMDVETMPTGMLYHLHTELILADRIDQSAEVARMALERPDIGRPEKYEIFLNFAEASKSDEQKEIFLNQAYFSDPTRREALGLMAVVSLRRGELERSLALARQMMATAAPKEIAWNERTGCYGWIGQDIYCQALRANGHFDEAEKVRRAALMVVGGPLIALVHATRGRPEMAAATRKKWLELASHPERVEHIFVFDDDDPQSKRLQAMHHHCAPAGGGCVAAWNLGAFSTMAPVIVQLSDDWTPPQQWDKLILERIGDLNEKKVLAVSDGFRKDKLLCMAICTRRYLEHDHFLFHPGFTGVYSDNWFTELAYARGAVIEAPDLVFTHNHFLKTGQVPDATYQRQNSPQAYHDGKAVLDRLHAGNDWSSVPGWFNFYFFYDLMARQLKDGDTVAEIGVWMGRSIIFLAQTCQRLGKGVSFIAVDTFQGETDQPEHSGIVREHGGSIEFEFKRNLLRYGVFEDFITIPTSSILAAALVEQGELALCFIDAAHDYESVCGDIRAWLPKVRAGGIIAGHDYQHEPVRRAVADTLGKVDVMHTVWLKRV
jgi:hypothetical protein